MITLKISFLSICVLSKSLPTNPKNLKSFFAQFNAISTNGSSFRNDPINAQNMNDKLPDYGCWCKHLYTGNGWKGRPVDEVDEICRQWSKCRKCEEITQCEGDLDLNYTPTIAFDFATLTLVTTCDDMNECTTNRCECDLFHVAKLSEIIATGTIDDSKSNLGIIDCHHGGGSNSGVAVQHACCGVAPSWQLFDKNSKTCNGGILE